MELIAQTTLGPVEGREKEGVLLFAGIPYAAPPVGPLRFRPPQPHAGWTQTRPYAISSNGRTIVGSGFNPDGHKRGWVVTIPEPSTPDVASSGGNKGDEMWTISLFSNVCGRAPIK